MCGGGVDVGGDYGLQNSPSECTLSSYLYLCRSTLIFCSLGQKRRKRKKKKSSSNHGNIMHHRTPSLSPLRSARGSRENGGKAGVLGQSHSRGGDAEREKKRGEVHSDTNRGRGETENGLSYPRAGGRAGGEGGSTHRKGPVVRQRKTRPT